MQTTQALYRRWRPARFSDVVAQEAIVAALRHQVASGRIAHAYLFCGSRGTGKTSMAHILARAVNCQSPEQGDACGKCEACQRLAAENNLDVVEIDAASNNGVDDIRDLREKVKYPPQHGRFRVYIIDEVHMLSSGAFNAFLKTLEEPPSHVVFILATTEPQRLPSTILSRCQRYDFHRIEAPDIAQRLKKIVDSMGVDAEPEALMILARAAEGAMRDAISMLDMCLSYGEGTLTAEDARRALGATDPAFLFELAQAFLDGDAAAALLGVDRALREGAEAQVLARNVAGHLRALLLARRCGDALPELLSVTGKEAEQYRAQAGRSSDENLLRILDLFLASEHDMKWASQPRVALEAAAVRACLPERALQLEALAARVEQLEKALDKALKAGIAAPPQARPQERQAEAPRAAPARPQARPAQQAAGADGQAVWTQALQALARIQPGLHAALKQATLLGLEGDVARIVFEPAKAVFQTLVQGPERTELIQKALEQAAGRPMGFEIAAAGAKPDKPKAPSSESMLDKVFDAFGREHVQVIDDDTLLRKKT